MAYVLLEQPTAGPGMSANGGGGDRNDNEFPVGAGGLGRDGAGRREDGRTDGSREWSHSLFTCLGDAGTCITACFVPCITYGRIKRRVEHLNAKGIPDPERGGPVLSEDCMAHAAVSCFALGWVAQLWNRGNIRARYNIAGDPTLDCLASCCCSPCALTQESREIELEERKIKYALVNGDGDGMS